MKEIDDEEEIINNNNEKNKENKNEKENENNIQNKLENKEKEKEEKDSNKYEVLQFDTPLSGIYKDEDKENTILILKSKIKKLKDDYTFYIKYHDILFNIINSLEELTYEKISNSINDSFNYISFFKASSEIYSKFAEQIKNTNNIIMSSKQLPKMNDNFLLEVMQNTQNTLYLHLSKLSNSLKQNIIANGPFSKFQEKINKIESIKKKQQKKFNEIDEMKKKLEYKYTKSYEKLFESFMEEKQENKDNNNLIIDSPDFICVIKDLLDDINKIILEINLFIIDTKDALYSINHLFVEINNLVRDSVLIYIQESKSIFNIDVTKNFEEIQKYYKKLDENPEDKMFKLEKIFNEQKHKENIYNLLEQYYKLLNDSGKVKKELISDRNNFSIKKYPNIYLFFEWLISISPQPTQLTIDDLIIKKVEVQREAGFFRGWKDSILIFTKQQHMILYDKPVTYSFETIVNIFELDKITFRKKLDYKKPFLFEINADVKGKLMNFKGTFLFDALNSDNLYDISVIFKDKIKK